MQETATGILAGCGAVLFHDKDDEAENISMVIQWIDCVRDCQNLEVGHTCREVQPGEGEAAATTADEKSGQG